MDFHELSHDNHKKQTHKQELIESWKRLDTVDYWRHERMYNTLLPLIKSYPKDSWLTVGDGRYGTDANYLMRQGIKALATDINDNLLKIAKEEGFIENYKRENAENMTFSNNEFDFVLCKEAYHHFPRPMLALYEMLRVCKKGIILIEPNDQETVNPFRMTFASSRFWFSHALKNILKVVLGRSKYIPEPRYEPVGNYVYSISKREIEKVALGLNMPAVSFKNLNDVYIEGVETEVLANQGPLLVSIKNQLHKLDAAAREQDEKYGLLIAVIFKDTPAEECTTSLKENGFTFQPLTRNPYSVS